MKQKQVPLPPRTHAIGAIRRARWLRSICLVRKQGELEDIAVPQFRWEIAGKLVNCNGLKELEGSQFGGVGRRTRQPQWEKVSAKKTLVSPWGY